MVSCAQTFLARRTCSVGEPPGHKTDSTRKGGAWLCQSKGVDAFHPLWFRSVHSGSYLARTNNFPVSVVLQFVEQQVADTRTKESIFTNCSIHFTQNKMPQIRSGQVNSVQSVFCMVSKARRSGKPLIALYTRGRVSLSLSLCLSISLSLSLSLTVSVSVSLSLCLCLTN